LKEEHKLQVFESEVLSKIFVPKGGKLSEEFRILSNEELGDLYTTQYCETIEISNVLIIN
jgi:hypothetical protein